MCLRLFLVTANVGSVFENIENGLKPWTDEVNRAIELHKPEFIAFHFQETGGKLYANGSEVIQIFFNVLVDTFKGIGFNLVEGFVDSDSELQHEFTALSSVYFIRDGMDDIQMWDFQGRDFVPIPCKENGKLLIGKDLQSAVQMQKQKFPQHFFPNFKWSRKGFLRTRWRLRGTIVDLVNIHMFHDSSNLEAASCFPSPFAQTRQRTLNYVLDLFQNDDLEKHPMFMFGDFNFRVDTFNVFTLLQNDTNEKATNSQSQLANSNNVQDGHFFVDSKSLIVKDHEEKFKYNYNWLIPYDFEAKQFESLLEFDVKFHPTYPFDESIANQFMRTRCPSWCDRVLFNASAKFQISNDSTPEYNLIGSDVCMGDHKPVYLTFDLKTQQDNNHNPRIQENFGPQLEKNLLDTLEGRKPKILVKEKGSTPSICSNLSASPTPNNALKPKNCGLVTFLKDSLKQRRSKSPSSSNNNEDINNDSSNSRSSNNQSNHWKIQNQSAAFENEIIIVAEEPSTPNNKGSKLTNNILLYSTKELILENSDSCSHKKKELLMSDDEVGNCRLRKGEKVGTEYSKSGKSRRRYCCW